MATSSKDNSDEKYFDLLAWYVALGESLDNTRELSNIILFRVLFLSFQSVEEREEMTAQNNVLTNRQIFLLLLFLGHRTWKQEGVREKKNKRVGESCNVELLGKKQ